MTCSVPTSHDVDRIRGPVPEAGDTVSVRTATGTESGVHGADASLAFQDVNLTDREKQYLNSCHRGVRAVQCSTVGEYCQAALHADGEHHIVAAITSPEYTSAVLTVHQLQ